MIILDTNVLSEVIRPAPAPSVIAWLDAQRSTDLFTTAISVGELLIALELLPRGRRRDALAASITAILQKFDGRILPFEVYAAAHYAKIVSATRKVGLVLPEIDAQIAAIASVAGCALATRDVKPFRAAGMTVINPWHPSH